MNRIMIAAPSSTTGKTTITCGLLRALKNRGINVTSFKCGPDYIDPMFHSKVVGVSGLNLDLFFQTEEQVKGYFIENCGEISVIEGVMGYYDGIGGNTDRASSYHLASVTKTPVILVVNPRGQSLSLVALIKGFMDFRQDSNICGVILNKCSKMMHDMLKPSIEGEGVKVLGYLPEIAEVALESRHLGLVTANEVADIENKLDVLAEHIENTVDVDEIIEIAAGACKVCGNRLKLEKVVENKVVAVATDEAFCFYYKDNLEVLRELGCEIKTFSPLEDEKLPANTSLIYIGGGYPELYAKKLSENMRMLEDIRRAVANNTPVIAECGGFMYLTQEIKGARTAGVLPGSCFDTKKLGRFGYIDITAKFDGRFVKNGDKIKAHEFHYWDCSSNGNAFLAKKPVTDREWECMVIQGNILAGFPHIYFRSNTDVIRRFVQCGI